MLYIVLFLSGCYLFHYINTKKKNDMTNEDIFYANKQTASSFDQPETEVII